MNRRSSERRCPTWRLDAYHNGEMKKLRTGQYRGKWLILFFYPADFTFVCPTELKDMAEHYDQVPQGRRGGDKRQHRLRPLTPGLGRPERGHKENPLPHGLGPARESYRALLGTYDENTGVSVRASFIVNPEGRIVAVEMTDDAIGRSAAELLRKLEAAVAVRESGGDFCPANWHAGEEMITPK